jgi:hypothetical protein
MDHEELIKGLGVAVKLASSVEKREMNNHEELIERLEEKWFRWKDRPTDELRAAAAIRELVAERNEMQRRSDGWIVSVDRSDGPDASVAVVSRRVGSEVQILEVIEIPAHFAGGER